MGQAGCWAALKTGHRHQKLQQTRHLLCSQMEWELCMGHCICIGYLVMRQAVMQQGVRFAVMLACLHCFCSHCTEEFVQHSLGEVCLYKRGKHVNLCMRGPSADACAGAACFPSHDGWVC